MSIFDERVEAGPMEASNRSLALETAAFAPILVVDAGTHVQIYAQVCAAYFGIGSMEIG